MYTASGLRGLLMEGGNWMSKNMEACENLSGLENA